MERTDIIVPAGIRYIGEWGDFEFSKFPEKCIINKVLPGCGFTEYCIRSHENVVLCSPRKMLLQNKADQHPGEVFLVKNELDPTSNVDKDVTAGRKFNSEVKTIDDVDDPLKNQKTLVIARIKKELGEYISGHYGKLKILVTYDSFRIVKEVLEDFKIFQSFYVVIDEFQTILQDSRFKSSTEINFLSHLKGSHSALFVSATPMLDQYIEMLDEFSGLPYYTLDWKTADFGRIVKPDLKVLTMDSINSASSKVIQKFLSGQYDSVKVERGGVIQEILATEIVLYVNSVDKIINIIKNNSLSPDQVNILCSNTPENQTRIDKRLGKRKGYKIGSVPLLGESNKPITLCTRTVYLGADFYSTCAKSYIFSDSNTDCLSVDISQDLPQILGRQRLTENPWKNQATLFYKTTADWRKMGKSDFDNIISKKTQTTYESLENYVTAKHKNTDANDKLMIINAYHYRDNYVAVNKVMIDGVVTLQPVFNDLVKVSEIRAFDIQQIDYADRFSVFAALKRDAGTEIGSNSEVAKEISEFFGNYEKITRVSEKLRFLCEAPISEEARNIILDQLPDSDRSKMLYNALGPDGCKADGYNITKMSQRLGIIKFSPEILREAIYYQFKEGDRYSLRDLKELLKQIYKTISYSNTPKASDLEEFFDVKRITINDNGKRINGYELIKKLK